MALIVALSGAIAAHHSGIALGETHHDGVSPVVEMCAAAFVAVGATVAAVTIGRIALGRWSIVIQPTPVDALSRAGTRGPAARAGPSPPLSLLCMWRR